MGVNMKTLKKVLVWSIATVVFGFAGLYAAIVYSTLDRDPGLLLSCVNVSVPWSAWTCKQVLRHASLTPEQVRDLNAEAGALYPVLMDDKKEAEEMLALFLSRGVDINAGHQQTKGWTALHLVSMGDPPANVALLLKHGARIDIRDEDGMTPLDLARHMQQKYPNNPNLPETIRLLEAAERK
jgi:hypothetical protein